MKEIEKPAYIKDGDYVKGGLWFCGKCHNAKQKTLNMLGKEYTVRIDCECERKQHEAETKAEAERERRQRIDHLRAQGIKDPELARRSFLNSTQSEGLLKCKRYVDSWPEMKKENIGLLLWGDTGNGKTHAAACIANALIEQEVPVMMTSFPRILQGGFNKSDLLAEMQHYQMIVIDDFGAERQSEYSLETVYLIIDELYKAKKPLIITTNLDLEYDFRRAPDVGHQRIYDRILEMCVPLLFTGENIRQKRAFEKLKKAKELLDI
jgi:DNA replication protein DnaC